MSMESPVVVRREPPLAWIIINRPTAHNALNASVWRDLPEVVNRLDADPDVRVLIVRGAGDRAFIAGADITEFQSMRADSQMTASYDRLTAEAWSAMGGADKPVIAMINGLCYGGGVSIACACDLRFAADHARFAIPATRLGLSYPMEGGITRLVQIVGPGHAADLLLSAQPIDAQEAWRIGLVNKVVAASELEARTTDYARTLAEGAPLTLAAHKRAIQECLRAPETRDAAKLAEAMRRCFDSADYQEGIAAFMEKRKPRFQGR